MSSRQRASTKRKNAPAAVASSEEREGSPSDGSAPSSSKRQKPAPEKRLRRYRATMTMATFDRIERALNQRLYLLAISKSSEQSVSREYKVLGQTANVYTVVITHIPLCTCPDYAKGHLCKHIIFVMHRVLKVSRNSPLIYQQALLTNELHQIFSGADDQNGDSSILAEQTIREAYRAKTGDPDVILTSRKIEQKLIASDDECPICFESMLDEPANVIFCSTSCGNNLHKNCFDKWRRAKATMGEMVTCPFCRSEWQSTTDKVNNPNGYLNLAAYSTTDDYDEDADDWMFFNYW